MFAWPSYHYFINFSLCKDSFLFCMNLIQFVVVFGNYVILSKTFMKI